MIIVLTSFSNSIFKYSFSSRFMAIPIISGILYVFSQLYLLNIIFSLNFVHRKDDLYDSSEWDIKIFDKSLLNQSKSKLEYYWNINEKISSEHNVTFQGLIILRPKKVNYSKIHIFYLNIIQKFIQLNFVIVHLLF